MSRFILLTAERSGSNFLRGFLQQHPRISCLGEVLRPDYDFADFGPGGRPPPPAQAEKLRAERAADPAAFLAGRVWPDPAPSARLRGCKLFTAHIQQQPSGAVLDYLAAAGDLKVLLLWRADRLRRHVSLLQAEATGLWIQSRPSRAPLQPVLVERSRLEGAVARTEGELDEILAALAHLPRHNLLFEDLARDWRTQMQGVFAFLGLPPCELVPVTKPQGGARLEATVLNLRDLMEQPPSLRLSAAVPPPPRPQPPPRRTRPEPRQKVWPLFSQVCADDLDLLPHFLAHYRTLGVTEFHLVLHGDQRECAALAKAAAGFPVTIEETYEGEFREPDKCERLSRAIRRHAGRWVLVADADEFLELPYRTLSRTAQALQVLGLRGLPATLLQRLTDDGSLPAAKAGRPPDRLYPLASLLLCERMNPALQPWKSKVPLLLAEPDTRLRGGHHLAPGADFGHALPLRGVVHHFKWRAAFLAALERRAALAQANAAEVRGYRGFLERNARRLPLDGSFRPTRPELERRGLLRRPDRAQLRLYGFLGRLRHGRLAAAPGRDPDGDLRSRARRLWRHAPDLPRDDGSQPPVLPEQLAGRALRIGLVTFQLPYSDRSAGAGTAVAASAEALALAGHEVKILYAPLSGLEVYDAWRELWESRGLEIVTFPFHAFHASKSVLPSRLPHEALAWLDGQGFDVLHFHDCLGLGATATVGKQAGVMFARTRLVVTAHGSTPWHWRANGLPFFPNLPRLDHQERLQLEYADHLVSPSRYMLEWLRQEGHVLPHSSFVHPNLMSGTTRLSGRTDRRPKRVTEIVFFGRVEPRKGLGLFMEALDRVAAAGGPLPRLVTFLGRPDPGSDAPRLLEGRHRWPFPSQLIADFDSETALQYLMDSEALCVLPSRRDNFPYTVLECVINGVPFLATRTGGIPDIVAPEDHERILVAEEAVGLSTAILRALGEGIAPAASAVAPDAALLWWLAWHGKLGEEAELVDRKARRRAGPWSAPDRPHRLDLCLLEEPGVEPDAALEAAALQAGVSLRLHAATHLLEQGAGPPQERAEVAPGQAGLAVRALTLPPGLSQGRQGNLLAAAGELPHLAFATTAMTLDQRALRVLLDALEGSGADAVVSAFQVLGLRKEQRDATPVVLAELQAWAGPLAYGAYENLYGAPCFAIRRQAFESLGGFREAAGLGRFAAADLLNRLQLGGGKVLPLGSLLYGLNLSEHVTLEGLRPDAMTQRVLVEPFLENVMQEAAGATMAPALELLATMGWHGPPELALIEVGRSERVPDTVVEEQAVTAPPFAVLRDKQLAQVRPLGHASVARVAQGLEVHSAGEDPILLLRPIRLPRRRTQYLVEVEVEASQNTQMQLFWATRQEPDYSEAKSARRWVRRGQHRVSFATPPIEAVGYLRLDPMTAPGRITILAIAVHAFGT